MARSMSGSGDFAATGRFSRPDLGLVVYAPVTPQDAERVRQLIARRERDGRRRDLAAPAG